MTTTSILTMILILGFVIGGFVYFLLLAIRKESKEGEEDSLTGHPGNHEA